MSGAFFLALVAAFLAGFGGRDQLLVAVVRDRLGAGPALIVVVLFATAATSAIAAWAGVIVALSMSDSAEAMLVAIAFAIAAFELAWWRDAPTPIEPTRSIGALFLVLLARQIGDAPRLVIFALAAATGAPAWAAAGGAVGSATGMIVALVLGRTHLEKLPLRRIRQTLAAMAVLCGVIVALNARGMIG